MSSSTAKPAFLYHIAEPEVWRRGGDLYVPEGFANEGFVHLSTRDQVLATAARYYASRDDLLLLKIDVGALDKSIVFENLLGGSELFPHYYAELPRVAVVASEPLKWVPDAGFICSLL